MSIVSNRVAVLDAGGQYVDLVKKAVERQGFPVDILPLGSGLNKLEGKYDAIIISGSPASSHAETAPLPDPEIWQSKLPILGICYGMQSMVIAHGGQVAKNAIREDGRVTTSIDTSVPIYEGIKQELTALFTHGDFVTKVPSGFIVIGKHDLSNGNTAYSSIYKDNKYGVQFHPEVFDDTPEGYQIIKNFLILVARLKPDDEFKESLLQKMIVDKQKKIANQAKNRHVIAFVSGGVDSSVAATLAAGVIPKSHLHAYYIDSGFMREEDDLVIDSLDSAGLSVVKIDAAEEFAEATVTIDNVKHGPLRSTTDPELKRKIIGKAFVSIQNRLIRELKINEAMLLQGTNAADRIESGHSQGDSHTMTIKTHHNQVVEIQDLKAQGLLIEPIDDLFKDEVRSLGRELGLPDELVDRQPFPGPGLAIRIIASTESDEFESRVAGDQEKINMYLKENYDKKIDAKILPIRSVGVGGDERSHLSVVALSHGGLSSSDLAKLGADLPANFRNSVNRVIYNLTHESIKTSTMTKTLLTSDVADQLRHSDRIVFEEMRRGGLINKISQFPVVLNPKTVGGKDPRSIVLRPVVTNTFMTLQAMLPGRDLPDNFLVLIAKRIVQEVDNTSRVFLDLTNKPPATTEWE
jgi:GMP synthase (glutamine-hydrolysing)